MPPNVMPPFDLRYFRNVNLLQEKRHHKTGHGIMPHRKCRRQYNLPAHAHELTFSCQHRLPLLSKDRTRLWFIEALERARKRWEFDVWAYVIMPEHAHVLVWPRQPEYNIGMIIKGIKQGVARKAINYLRANSPGFLDRLKVTWPTGRIEYRFRLQGGGYDRNIDNSKTAWHSVNYLHNNPVRRGLVESPTDWEWSSAHWYAGHTRVRLAMDGTPPDAPEDA
jgi:putative transposase